MLRNIDHIAPEGMRRTVATAPFEGDERASKHFAKVLSVTPSTVKGLSGSSKGETEAIRLEGSVSNNLLTVANANSASSDIETQSLKSQNYRNDIIKQGINSSDDAHIHTSQPPVGLKELSSEVKASTAIPQARDLSSLKRQDIHRLHEDQAISTNKMDIELYKPENFLNESNQNMKVAISEIEDTDVIGASSAFWDWEKGSEKINSRNKFGEHLNIAHMSSGHEENINNLSMLTAERSTKVKTQSTDADFKNGLSLLSSESGDQGDKRVSKTYVLGQHQMGATEAHLDRIGVRVSDKTQASALEAGVRFAPSIELPASTKISSSIQKVDFNVNKIPLNQNTPAESMSAIHTLAKFSGQPTVFTTDTLATGHPDISMMEALDATTTEFTQKIDRAVGKTDIITNSPSVQNRTEAAVNWTLPYSNAAIPNHTLQNNAAPTGSANLSKNMALADRHPKLNNAPSLSRKDGDDRQDRREDTSQNRSITNSVSPYSAISQSSVKSINVHMNSASSSIASLQDSPHDETNEKSSVWAERNLEFAATGPSEMRPGLGPPTTAQSLAAGSQHHAPSVIRQMIEVSGHLRDGPVEVSLNPDELGRVRMQIASGEQGVVIHITAERGETLDMLRRHIDQLNRELSAMGYENPRFAFDREGGHQQRGEQSTSHDDQAVSSLTSIPNPDGPRQAATNGLDIRI